jgi:hypothetical protein
MTGWSRWALGLSGVAGLVSTLRIYLLSPAVVPVHFGPAGPDRWGSRVELLIAHTCIIGLSTAFFLAAPELFRRAPTSLLNLPNKEYWLSPEHRGAATTKFAHWSATVGVAVNALMLTLQLLLGPHQDGAAGARLALLVILVFVLFTLGSCVWLVHSFRMPMRAD